MFNDEFLQSAKEAGKAEPGVRSQPPYAFLTAREIQQYVANLAGTPIEDMTSTNKKWIVCHPRQMAMTLVRELTKRSLPRIGRDFGGRDHTTVLHATKCVARRRASSIEFEMEYLAAKHALEMRRAKRGGQIVL